MPGRLYIEDFAFPTNKAYKLMNGQWSVPALLICNLYQVICMWNTRPMNTVCGACITITCPIFVQFLVLQIDHGKFSSDQLEKLQTKRNSTSSKTDNFLLLPYQLKLTILFWVITNIFFAMTSILQFWKPKTQSSNIICLFLFFTQPSYQMAWT